MRQAGFSVLEAILAIGEDSQKQVGAPQSRLQLQSLFQGSARLVQPAGLFFGQSEVEIALGKPGCNLVTLA